MRSTLQKRKLSLPAAPSPRRPDWAFVGQRLQRVFLLWLDVGNCFLAGTSKPGEKLAQHAHRNQTDQDHATNEGGDRAEQRIHANIDACPVRPKDEGFENADGFVAGDVFEKHVTGSFRTRLSSQIGAIP